MIVQRSFYPLNQASFLLILIGGMITIDLVPKTAMKISNSITRIGEKFQFRSKKMKRILNPQPKT